MREKFQDERFLTALKEVAENEGGYANDPADPGGETKYGISKRSYPALDIVNLTVDLAADIIYRDFWLRYRYAEISNLELATEVLDIGMTNPYEAHVALQLAVQQTGGEWIDADGWIGPLTLRAVNNHPNPGWLTDRFRLNAIRHYLGCKGKYLAGQVRRALN